jgi:hypothetical protein
MSESDQITCSQHGSQDSTFVCQHIARSLTTGIAVGFHWPRENERNPRPDAWCSACERMRVDGGGDWTEEMGPSLDIQTLCGGCYDSAKDLWRTYRQH